MEYTFFFLPSFIFVKLFLFFFLHVVTEYSLLLLCAISLYEYTIIYLVILLLEQAVEWELGNFQSGAIINNDALKVYFGADIYALLLRIYLVVKLLCCRVHLCLVW